MPGLRFPTALLLCFAWVGAALAAAPDPRAAEARALAYAGDTAGAERVWTAVADDAMRDRDMATLDAARRALAELAFLRGRYGEVAAFHSERLYGQGKGDLRIEADARMELAVLERRQGRLDEARVGLEEAIQGFRRAQYRDGEGQALTHLGLVLLNQGAYVRALEVLDAAQVLHREGADVRLDRTYHYLALLYHGLRDYDDARGYLEQGLAEARRHPDPMRASPLLGSLARVANDQGLHSDALDYAAEAAEVSARFDSVPGVAYSALERGRALLGLGRRAEAREALEASRDLSRSIAQDRTAADATFSLGRVALAEGDGEAALRLFAEAVPNYEAARDAPQSLGAYRLMVPLLRERGEFERATRLAEAALDLQEQISGREMSRRIALVEYRHQAADSARRIELLTRENEIQQLRLERQTLGRYIDLGLIAGLLLIAATLAWAWNRSRRIGAELSRSNHDLLFSRRALAAANASLEEKAKALQVAATTDPLTGLANRRHVLDVLERVAASANAHHRAMSILLLDVDRFKSVNDGHGHGVGDRVLRRVARTLQALIPTHALLGRYGGEEFMLVLPDHDLETARQLAEAARRAVGDSRESGDPTVTLSIGVAARPAGAEVEVAALIDEADRALYRAKENGRDRVETGLRAA